MPWTFQDGQPVNQVPVQTPHGVVTYEFDAAGNPLTTTGQYGGLPYDQFTQAMGGGGAQYPPPAQQANPSPTAPLPDPQATPAQMQASMQSGPASTPPQQTVPGGVQANTPSGMGATGELLASIGSSIGTLGMGAEQQFMNETLPALAAAGQANATPGNVPMNMAQLMSQLYAAQTAAQIGQQYAADQSTDPNYAEPEGAAGPTEETDPTWPNNIIGEGEGTEETEDEDTGTGYEDPFPYQLGTPGAWEQAQANLQGLFGALGTGGTNAGLFQSAGGFGYSRPMIDDGGAGVYGGYGGGFGGIGGYGGAGAGGPQFSGGLSDLLTDIAAGNTEALQRPDRQQALQDLVGALEEINQPGGAGGGGSGGGGTGGGTSATGPAQGLLDIARGLLNPNTAGTAPVPGAGTATGANPPPGGAASPPQPAGTGTNPYLDTLRELFGGGAGGAAGGGGTGAGGGGSALPPGVSPLPPGETVSLQDLIAATQPDYGADRGSSLPPGTQPGGQPGQPGSAPPLVDTTGEADPLRDALADLIGQDAADALAGANAANEQRYEDILGGYRDREGQALALSNFTGNRQLRDLYDLYGVPGDTSGGQVGARVDQDLLNRGLGNTTVRTAGQLGVQRNRDRAMLDQADVTAAQRLGILRDFTGDTLGFAERRTDAAPDMGQIAGLLQQLGAAGPATGTPGQFAPGAPGGSTQGSTGGTTQPAAQQGAGTATTGTQGAQGAQNASLAAMFQQPPGQGAAPQQGLSPAAQQQIASITTSGDQTQSVSPQKMTTGQGNLSNDMIGVPVSQQPENAWRFGVRPSGDAAPAAGLTNDGLEIPSAWAREPISIPGIGTKADIAQQRRTPQYEDLSPIQNTGAPGPGPRERSLQGIDPQSIAAMPQRQRVAFTPQIGTTGSGVPALASPQTDGLGAVRTGGDRSVSEIMESLPPDQRQEAAAILYNERTLTGSSGGGSGPRAPTYRPTNAEYQEFHRRFGGAQDTSSAPSNTQSFAATDQDMPQITQTGRSIQPQSPTGLPEQLRTLAGGQPQRTPSGGMIDIPAAQNYMGTPPSGASSMFGAPLAQRGFGPVAPGTSGRTPAASPPGAPPGFDPTANQRVQSGNFPTLLRPGQMATQSTTTLPGGRNVQVNQAPPPGGLPGDRAQWWEGSGPAPTLGPGGPPNLNPGLGVPMGDIAAGTPAAYAGIDDTPNNPGNPWGNMPPSFGGPSPSPAGGMLPASNPAPQAGYTSGPQNPPSSLSPPSSSPTGGYQWGGSPTQSGIQPGGYTPIIPYSGGTSGQPQSPFSPPNPFAPTGAKRSGNPASDPPIPYHGGTTTPRGTNPPTSGVMTLAMGEEGGGGRAGGGVHPFGGTFSPSGNPASDPPIPYQPPRMPTSGGMSPAPGATTIPRTLSANTTGMGGPTPGVRPPTSQPNPFAPTPPTMAPQTQPAIPRGPYPTSPYTPPPTTSTPKTRTYA